MDLQTRIDMILDQMIQGEWGNASGPDFRTLRAEGYVRELDLVIPAAWLLCTEDTPQARQSIRCMVDDVREAVDAVEALLDTIEAAEKEADAAGHPEWAPLLAILKTPFPLEKPDIFDPSFVPCISVMLRDVAFDGSWEAKLRWIEEEGGEDQKAEDLPLNRSLQQFEETYNVNLADLLFSERDKIEHEMMREEYQRRGWEAFLEPEDKDAGKRSGKRGKGRRRRRR